MPSAAGSLAAIGFRGRMANGRATFHMLLGAAGVALLGPTLQVIALAPLAVTHLAAVHMWILGP